MRFRSIFPDLIYLSALVFLSLVIADPKILIFLLAVSILRVILASELEEWWKFVKLASFMALPILIINPIFNSSGSSVILSGPVLPLIGHIRITFESLNFTIIMVLRLLITLSAFALLNLTVDQDALLRLFSKVSIKSAFSIAVSTRLFPVLSRDAVRIAEAQKCRGARYDKVSIIERIKIRIPLLNILLINSLERAIGIAESMESRGFGTGRRSDYRSMKVGLAGVLSLVLSIASLTAYALLNYIEWHNIAVCVLVATLIPASLLRSNYEPID